LAAALKIDHTLYSCHSGGRKVWFRTPAHNPIQHLSRTLRLRFPRQAFLRVGHALPPEAPEKLPITCKFAQNLFDLCYYIILISSGDFVAHLGMDNIPGASVVKGHGEADVRATV